jgi:bile acid-coenzyme A ligase
VVRVAFDERLEELAADDGGRPALLFPAEGRTVSYGELNAVTAALREELLGTDRVLVVDSPDGPDSYLSLIAALRCPKPVAVRSRLTGDQTAEIVRRAPEPLPPNALVLPTGGTSGDGRRVVDVRTRAVSAQPRPLRLTSVLGWRPRQVQLMASRPPHASAMSFLVEGLTDGNTVVVAPGFQAAAFLALIDAHRVEWVQVTPFHLRMLRRADDGGASLGSLRALVHMSARCPADLKRYWIDRLGPERVFETYGSTEGIGVTAVGGAEWLERPGTVGRGFFTKVTIVGPHGDLVAPGVRGTVYTSTGRRGTPVYLNHRGDLRRSADGSVSVGDEGWLDPDGYLYLAPRPLTRITVAGETFDAEDLEDVLCGHPSVADAGVCAVPLGEDRVRVVALVVPDGPAFSEPGLRRWLRARLTAAIVPRRVFRVDALPRDGAGKLSRRGLRDLGDRLMRRVDARA